MVTTDCHKPHITSPNTATYRGVVLTYKDASWTWAIDESRFKLDSFRFAMAAINNYLEEFPRE